MSFFDSKEEVLQFQLTSYGKLLLSKGLLKPVYYSFHDDDILYDSTYASQEELASKAEVRIQDETLYVKPLYSFSSAKATIDKAINQELFLNTINNLNEYKVDYFDNSLGESSISNLYIPSWSINSLSKKFVSISSTFSENNLRIPQFECVLTASFVTTNTSVIDSDFNLQNLMANQDITYIDDMAYFINVEELVLKIEENNTDADFDKFDIEIYEVTENNDGTESYSVLKMPKKINFVDENNILQNLSSLGNNNSDSTYSNSYLEVLTDKEITTESVCKHILLSTRDQDSIFNDYNICDNVRTGYSTNNLYEIFNDRATGRNC
jgi:hypothetical protein